jgi:HAD superfamily hydrolase (TIGR01490 family)
MSAALPTPSSLPVFAFFDVDNTLLHGASLFTLANAARRLGMVKRRDILRFAFKALSFRRKGENLDVLDQVRERALELLGDLQPDRLHALAGEVVDRLHPRLWPETMDLLREHCANGHQVWLLSATPDFLAAELAARVGATGGLGTPLEIVDGSFTGHFGGPTMHAEEKAVAARRLMAERNADPVDSYAYSDSINDLPLLEAVGTAVAINPDRALTAHARSAGWRILRLDPASIRAERKRVRESAAAGPRRKLRGRPS